MSEVLTRSYTFSLPKGDDLAQHLAVAAEAGMNPLELGSDALWALADECAWASQVCYDLSNALASVPGVELVGEGHRIRVTGPASVLDPLVEEGGLLTLEPEVR